MFKDVIECVIKKVVGGDVENYDEICYEGYGFNGVVVIVEIMIDNKNWIVLIVCFIFFKNGGNFGEMGFVGFMFECKGEVVYLVDVGDVDDIMMFVIEVGVEDVESLEDGYIIYCVDMDFNDVLNVFEVDFGEFEFIKLIWKLMIIIEFGFEDM